MKEEWVAEGFSRVDRDVWSGLAVFAEIVDAGSFAAAAKRLGVSPSALSHAMRSLETRLDIRLLNRTTRSLAPTEAGQVLLTRLQPAMTSVQDVLGELEKVRSRPTASGPIAVTRRATRASLFCCTQRPGRTKLSIPFAFCALPQPTSACAPESNSAES
ncbi:LysR family transcriptional regulator [Sphingomicrobium sp. XHP0239]|uniref:LysR family transcriptional regulator n=1 Tax=Sphingomicrobium maritimum TaxID=3133972 RepID=UPI0031CC9A30